MGMQKFKIALNTARFPLVASQATQPALIAPLDVAPRSQSRAFFGAEENADFNVPNILYGENFVPYAHGIKSVSYVSKINPSTDPLADFDQAFQLRDAEENAVLFSPSKGNNYIYDNTTETWNANISSDLWLAETTPLYLSDLTTNTPSTAKVTRAYVNGSTFVCYGRIALSTLADGSLADRDGSIYTWRPSLLSLSRTKLETGTGAISNVPIPIGEIDGIASSNGYLLMWSTLTVYWALFDGTRFDFSIYVSGAPTGSGNQIPEDVKGPITAIVPVAGGFVIFTTRNAVAAQYNSNNILSPWIFREISNAGGVESFEQVGVEGTLGALYAYTTGGLQKITLNSAESFAPDVSDFLGGRLIDNFNSTTAEIQEGQITIEAYIKLTYIASRFLVISYGTYPGIFSYALIYDTGLMRWGKFRIVHRDCLYISLGVETAELTYAMVNDVTYDDLAGVPYEDATINSTGITYPRQAVGFLLRTGEIKLAAMDHRDQEEADDSEAFVVIGKVQLSRNYTTVLHAAEFSGLKSGCIVKAMKSFDGYNLESGEDLVLRGQTGNFSEWGADMITAKSYAIFVKGDFSLSSAVLEASQDAGNY